MIKINVARSFQKNIVPLYLLPIGFYVDYTVRIAKLRKAKETYVCSNQTA